MQNLYGNIDYKQSLKPQELTTTANGTSVDTKNYEGATFVVDAGVTGGTTPVFTLKLQESDDASSWSDIAAADLLGGTGTITINAAGDDQTYVREYIGEGRYLRVICSAASGTSPTADVAAAVVLHRARHIGTAV